MKMAIPIRQNRQKSFLLFHLSKQILQSGIDASAREVEILRLIAAGMRNQEIADHLFISLHTVKSRPGGTNVYGKLGVSHHTEAVARANELKLIG